MALHCNNIHSYLKIKNLRQSSFFAEFMVRHEIFRNRKFNVNNISECQHQIAEYIAQAFPENTTMQKQFVQDMKTAFETELLNDEDMKWIRTDARACCFVWGMIRIAKDDYLGLDNNSQSNSYGNHYSNESFPLNTTSTQERYNIIVQFFDSLRATIFQRHQLLSRISDDWAKIYNSGLKPFEWLDKNNEDQCNWTWRYINSYKFAFATNPLLRLFNPTNHNEEYLSIFAIWDLWLWHRPSNSDIELFLIKISKAQSQRKHREKAAEKGVVLVSTSLHNSTKNKLDELATMQGKKINELLTILINAEYERSKQGA